MFTKQQKVLMGVAAVSAMAVATGAAEAKDTIKIAVPSFLSGGAAGPFGVPARNGAELVINAINAGKLPAPIIWKLQVAESCLAPRCLQAACQLRAASRRAASALTTRLST